MSSNQDRGASTPTNDNCSQAATTTNDNQSQGKQHQSATRHQRQAIKIEEHQQQPTITVVRQSTLIGTDDNQS